MHLKWTFYVLTNGNVLICFNCTAASDTELVEEIIVYLTFSYLFLSLSLYSMIKYNVSLFSSILFSFSLLYIILSSDYKLHKTIRYLYSMVYYGECIKKTAYICYQVFKHPYKSSHSHKHIKSKLSTQKIRLFEEKKNVLISGYTICPCNL